MGFVSDHGGPVGVDPDGAAGALPFSDQGRGCCAGDFEGMRLPVGSQYEPGAIAPGREGKALPWLVKVPWRAPFSAWAWTGSVWPSSRMAPVQLPLWRASSSLIFLFSNVPAKGSAVRAKGFCAQRAALADNADFAAEEGEAQGIEQRGGTVFERFGAQDGLKVRIDAVQHFAAGHDADGELGRIRK